MTTNKIRKTYISTLIDSGLNIDEIRRLAGHADERTTCTNYCFITKTPEETRSRIETSLNTVKSQDLKASFPVIAGREPKVTRGNQISNRAEDVEADKAKRAKPLGLTLLIYSAEDGT